LPRSVFTAVVGGRKNCFGVAKIRHAERISDVPSKDSTVRRRRYVAPRSEQGDGSVRRQKPSTIIGAGAGAGLVSFLPCAPARPFDAAAIIVSNVIGGGSLFSPPEVAAHVPRPWLFLATWLAGGALAFAGAMAYAELATLRPRAGGEYVYLDAAFGRIAAFLTGWTSFFAGFSGAIATSAVVFAFYLGRFVPVAASDAPLLVVPIPWIPFTVSRQALVALAVIALMCWVHVRGVGPGRIVGNAMLRKRYAIRAATCRSRSPRAPRWSSRSISC
jgi:hypothetical protein